MESNIGLFADDANTEEHNNMIKTSWLFYTKDNPPKIVND